MSHIEIIDLDELIGPEQITVRHTGSLPDHYMRNVIYLASIVGNHHVSREAYISEYTHTDYSFDGMLIA